MQRLALHLTTWEITSFLIGEYAEQELRDPVFTVADGILWLSQAVDRNSVVRKLQVVKVRGMAPMPGLHTIRMTDAGVQVFPRIPERAGRRPPEPDTRGCRPGSPGLDEMMGGGIPAGDSLVLAGPTGTGKTTFAMQFVAAGLGAGEAAVIAVFEEHPEVYLERAKSVGVDLREAVREDKLRIIYLRPARPLGGRDAGGDPDGGRADRRDAGRHRFDLGVRDGAGPDLPRGFPRVALPAHRRAHRARRHHVLDRRGGGGAEGSAGLQLTGYRVSFLTDDIISQRYVEIEGELRKVLAVVKMRGSDHSREFRAYEITATGVLLRESLRDYDGIITGMPTRQLRIRQPTIPG